MKAKDWVTEFVEELQQRAEDRRAEGAQSADVYARVANELETRRRAHLHSRLSTKEAAEESGYSEEQLRKMRREKKWSGQRYDLPRRPGHNRPEARGLTLAQEILSTGGVSR